MEGFFLWGEVNGKNRKGKREIYLWEQEWWKKREETERQRQIDGDRERWVVRALPKGM